MQNVQGLVLQLKPEVEQAIPQRNANPWLLRMWLIVLTCKGETFMWVNHPHSFLGMSYVQ